MPSLTDCPAIRGFVKDTLGCACPDEVFDDIEYHPNASQETPYTAKLLIGRRLLIYLVHPADASSLYSLLPILIAEGKRERDDKGLNRFRAVLVTPEKDQLEPLAVRLFAGLDDRDDRVHLHVVSPVAVKAIELQVSDSA